MEMSQAFYTMHETRIKKKKQVNASLVEIHQLMSAQQQFPPHTP